MQNEPSPTTTPTRPPSATTGAAGPGRDDPLAEIDLLMQNESRELKSAADHTAEVQAARSEFSSEFTKACDEQVRPAMETVLERLRRNGGGGMIEERPENTRQHQAHRLTLWMSFRDEINGAPRQDRHPYLQLDAEVDKRSVTVSEGDMWLGSGGSRSGKTGEWQLADISAAGVTQEILAIIRRALKPAVSA